jgi:DNA-binding transcriptional ArsR family regulator
MRLVDLRGAASATPPTVEVRASAAAELLRLVGVLLAPDPEGYDVGAERIAALRDRVPPELLRRARALGAATRDSEEEVRPGEDKAWLVLSLIGAYLPEPAGVEELVTFLRADPALAWRALLAHHVQDLVPEDHRTRVLPRMIQGDPEALDQVRSAALTADHGRLQELVDRDPVTFGAEVVTVIEGVETALWAEVAAEAMGPIERDVAHRQQQLAAGVDPTTVVLEATNGYELPEDAAGHHVVLLPSYWMRPWLVVGPFLGSRTPGGPEVEVLSTVVADQFLALPSEAPPPALLKLVKALADEGRLTLLRRMAGGPISLSEATEALDVAKATAHHHLSILRQAGLVSMSGEGRSTRYALRDDPAEVARDALAGYVPTRR